MHLKSRKRNPWTIPLTTSDLRLCWINVHMLVTSVMPDSLWPMDCTLPGSSVHGILQARILEWVAMPSSRGASQPGDQTCVSYVSCTGRRGFLPNEPPRKPQETPPSKLGAQEEKIEDKRTYLMIVWNNNHCAMHSCSVVCNSLWPHGL